MYKKRGVSLNLEEVLAKLNKQPLPKKPHTPVVYSNTDILAAKKVLQRLLKVPARNEISSIRVIPEKLEER